MSGVAVTREGAGPEVLLVHGGASARRTWAGVDALAARWTLAHVHRRGYAPSPPEPGRGHDFAVDADDIFGLLAARPHLVAHSYGALGTLLAAQRAPERVRSLTIIEPPLAHLVDGDPDVAEFERIGDEILLRGLDSDPADLRTFLRVSGAGDFGPGPLPGNVSRAVSRAQGARLPREAQPRLDVLRDAGVPALVASGGHSPAIERICDVVADRLGARRLVVPGAGHFVAAAPGFAARLEEFLAAAQSRSETTPA